MLGSQHEFHASVMQDDLAGVSPDTDKFIKHMVSRISNDPDHFCPPNNTAVCPLALWRQAISSMIYRGSARAAIILSRAAMEKGCKIPKLGDLRGLRGRNQR